MKLNVVKASAERTATAMGIPEKRQIELLEMMDKMMNFHFPNVVNNFEYIASECNNLEEFAFCIHSHTIVLVQNRMITW